MLSSHCTPDAVIGPSYTLFHLMLTPKERVRDYLYFINKGSGTRKERVTWSKEKQDLDLGLPVSSKDCTLFIHSHGKRNWL